MRIVGLRYYGCGSAISNGSLCGGSSLRYERASVRPPVRQTEHNWSYRVYCGGLHVGHLPHFASVLLAATHSPPTLSGQVRSVGKQDADYVVDASIDLPSLRAPAGYTLTCPQKNTCGVYAIVNLCDMRVYIGQSEDVDKRRQQHLADLQQGRHFKKALLRDWQRNREAFAFVVIDEQPQDVARQERHRIYIYGADEWQCGYNYGKGRSPGGGRKRQPTNASHETHDNAYVPPLNVVASVNGLPPLPGRRSLASIAAYLRCLGVEVVNHRKAGGGAWVLQTAKEFAHIAVHLQNNGIEVRRFPNGRKRYPGDHYGIDPNKRLPEH